jgi:hypothetical protein
MDRLSSVIEPIKRLFALDLRSLACLRIGLGLLILIDLLLRSRDLVAFYTDQGLLPRSLLTTSPNALTHWSLHLVNGAPWFQALLFCVAGIAAGMLVAGYRTTWAATISWVLLASLHLRNPLILNAGDKYLALLTFWGIFLPWGAKWSVDAKKRANDDATTVISLASFALYLQVALVYVSTALLKWQHSVWQTGDAIQLALSKDYIVTSWGQWLAEHPEWIKPLTPATLYLELLSPVAILLSKGWWRVAVLVVLALFHVALAACFTIGLFPYVCLVAYTAFLPGKFWAAVLKDSARSETKLYQPPRTHVVLRGCKQTFLALAILVSLWSCVSVVSPSWRMPEVVRNLERVFRWRQSWKMFTNIHEAVDGWFVFHAQFADGHSEDLLSGASPVSYEKPSLASAMFPNMRWRKLCTNLKSPGAKTVREFLGDYLLLDRDRRHHDVHKLIGLEIVCVEPAKAAIGENVIEVLGATFATPQPLDKEVLFEWHNEARKYHDVFIRE